MPCNPKNGASGRALTALFVITLIGSAAAQTTLEEIIVTAQKREQNLQDVPISVGTMNKDNFNATVSAGADILALSARLPSLLVESSNGRLIPRFYIRGLGNIDFDINASQPVSMIYDDVVLENPVAKGFPLFDIERVEVLRGPQGSLFGRNTTAGIIKFDSVRPTAETDGYLAASYGRYNQRTVEGALGGTLSAQHGLNGRASLFYNGLDDWIDNRAPGFEQDKQLGGFDDYAGRVQLQWQPNTQLYALLNLHGRVLDDGTPTIFHGNSIVKGTNDFVDGFRRDKVLMDAGSRQRQEQNQYGIIATVKYDFDTVTLTSISGFHTVTKNFSHGDVDGGYGSNIDKPTGPAPGIPFDAETADALSDHEQFTQEIRFSSNGWTRGFWQAGLYYFTEELQIDTINFESARTNPGAVDGRVKQTQDTTAWAIFGTVEYQLNQRWTLTAGLRYSDDEKKLTAQRLQDPLYFYTFVGATPPGLFGPETRKTSEGLLTGDLAVSYVLNDEVNLYARLARGHRAPSIQGRVLFGGEITVGDTEENHSIEAGLKGEFLNRRLRLNSSVFYYQLSNQQLTAVGGTTNANVLTNADRTKGAGMELELEFIPTDNWLLTGGISYNHTRIDDDGLMIDTCGSQAQNQGCTPGDRIVGETSPPVGKPVAIVSIDGNSLYNAPRWIANGSLRYSRPLANGELYLHTDWAYRSKVNFTLYRAIENSDDFLLEGGVKAGYISGDGRYEYALFGRNILNDESLIGIVDFNNLTSFVNNPPMWGIEFRARFGQQ